MDRINHLKAQLCSGTAGTSGAGVQTDTSSITALPDKDLCEIPVVSATKQTVDDPIHFLLDTAEKYPDLFFVDRGQGNKYLVVSDAMMYEDILTFDSKFGNPQAPNMLVNKTIFKIPMEQLDKHEQNVISGLRKYLLNHNAELADQIAAKLQVYMKRVLGDSGEMDLRQFGEAIFWPMTEALFGPQTAKSESPNLFKQFEDIDNFFGKALKGRPVPEVDKGVKAATELFTRIAKQNRAHAPETFGKCPIISFYDELTNKESEALTGKFATAAWWGGQGNTLPSTVWTFGLILNDEEAKKKVYAEVDEYFKTQPDASGHYDYSKLVFTTSCLKEALRLTTYSIAWRHCQMDTILTARSGNKYLIPKDTLIGLHFALNHHTPEIFPDPFKFAPERFVPYNENLSPVINGIKYAWVPFSAGRHKCSGYPLAMLEIPLAIAIFFKEYDLKLLDPLPGFNFKQAFGVIGPDEKPVRVRYQKRR